MDENDKKKLAYHKYYFDPRYTPHSHMEFGTLLCWGTNLVDDIFSTASTSRYTNFGNMADFLGV